MSVELSKILSSPCAWRAAYALYNKMEENDNRLQSSVNQIIDMLPVENASLNREFLRILQKMEIDENYEGKLFDICLTFWKNPKYAQSIRYNALKILLKTAKKYPELNVELANYLEYRYLASCTSGIKHSIKLMLKK